MKCFVSGSQLFSNEGIRLGFAFVKNKLHAFRTMYVKNLGFWFGLFIQTLKY